MYKNNSNQMYNPKMQGVDNLLKDLGAEPLFSSISDKSRQPELGIPTPLNGPNNTSTVTYNNNAAQAQEQKAFQEAFVALLQKINEQNTPNFGQDLQQNQFSNQFSSQSLNQNSNQNISNFISNQNSNQAGLPNPISILNEMHQRYRRSSFPPKYSFMIDPTNGQFYCQLEAFGKVFKTERSWVRKQQAKEDVALQALRSIVGENHSPGNNGSEIMKLYDPSFNYLENRTDAVSKSETWYRKQRTEFPGKQPRVILLEFCQMHHLPNPMYQPYNDYSGNTYFECMIGDKYFKSDRAFPKSSEAKDYIANIAFEAIFREICDADREQARRRNGTEQDASKSSLLNFLENHTSSHVSNYTPNQSNYTQSHTPGLSNYTSSQSNNSYVSNHISNPVISPVSGSMSTIPSVTSNLKLVSNSDVNNSSHLNELTTALVLPNFNNEVSNFKVDEASPLMPVIKPDEGNIGNNGYFTRDQQQSSSSPISFHPYRSPGRERFQSPVFNSSSASNNIINNNSSNNQFAKKNAGFSKKFTSLLYEMAQSKRWTPPEFNFENGINGFICVCNVQDYLFKGKACTRKMDAKESAAEEAYRFLTRNFRV